MSGIHGIGCRGDRRDHTAVNGATTQSAAACQEPIKAGIASVRAPLTGVASGGRQPFSGKAGFGRHRPRLQCPHVRTPQPSGPVPSLLRGGVSHMSDLVFIGLTIVAFALIGLAARGVGRL
ncbi:hypothetical protein GCM10009753_39820 [Streptantibioticus ferralitis]